MAVNRSLLTVLLIGRRVPVEGHLFASWESSFSVSKVIVVYAGIIVPGIALELIRRGADVTVGIIADLIASRRSEHAIASFRVDRF